MLAASTVAKSSGAVRASSGDEEVAAAAYPAADPDAEHRQTDRVGEQERELDRAVHGRPLALRQVAHRRQVRQPGGFGGGAHDRLGHHVGGERADLRDVGLAGPACRWRARRPCRRRPWCATGKMARAKPSSAISAMRCTSALVSFALVATRPMVVFSPGRGRLAGRAGPQQLARVGEACRRRLRTPATTLPVSGSMMSPTALTATMAPTTRPFGMRIA